MDSDSSPRQDAENQSCYEFGFGQFCNNDDDQASWITHSNDADVPSQHHQPDFPNPPSSAHNPAHLGPDATFGNCLCLGVSSEWAEGPCGLCGGFPDLTSCSFDSTLPYADPFAAPSLTATLAEPAPSFEDVGEQTMVGPEAIPATCKELDPETLLRRLRYDGYGYAAISEAMRVQLGIEISANALVKRYQKMPKTCEALLAKAISNIMPLIMEQLARELPHIDNGTLSDEDQKMVHRMMEELPQILPNCVRGGLSRKRRTMQPSASL